MHNKGSPNLGALGMSKILETLLFSCINHAEFCRFRSNPIGVCTVPKFCGTLEPRPRGEGSWLTPINTPHPHVCYHAEFDRSRSNDTNVYERITAGKTGPLHLAFQGHSRSSELIRIDRMPTTVLMIRCNWIQVKRPPRSIAPGQMPPVFGHPGQTPPAEMPYAVKSPLGQMPPPPVKRLPIR